MLPRWVFLAAICAVFLALADFLVKLASNKISPSLGMMIYGAVTFVFALSWLGYQRLTGQAYSATSAGVVYAVGVGVAFSLVTLLLYLTFARVDVSIGSPSIRLTGIILASLLGIVVLGEPITWRYVLGMVLALVGVVLVVLR